MPLNSTEVKDRTRATRYSVHSVQMSYNRDGCKKEPDLFSGQLRQIYEGD